MNLQSIREKILAFIIPIMIVGVVLGSIVWFIGQTYFWDVSRLTLQIPGDRDAQVTLNIQARIIYFDMEIFGYYYPVHITFPLSRTETCTSECTFDRLPPGDAILTLSSEAGIGRTRIFITPDTDGTLDLRPSFQIDTVTAPGVWDSFHAQELSIWEREVLPDIILSNSFWGLFLYRQSGQYFLYDTETAQSVAVSLTKAPHSLARGENRGEYLFWTDEGVIRWDRYGRTPTQILGSLKWGDYTFSWSEGTSVIQKNDGKQVLTGNWSPIFTAKQSYITNGEKIMEIK